MKTKEVYLYSDEIDEDLFHAIERQLGCHEALNVLPIKVIIVKIQKIMFT